MEPVLKRLCCGIFTTRSCILEKMDPLGLNKTDDSLIKYKSYLDIELQLQVNTEIKMKGRPDWAASDLSRTKLTIWNVIAPNGRDGSMSACGAISVLGSNEHSIYTVAALWCCQESFVDTKRQEMKPPRCLPPLSVGRRLTPKQITEQITDA